MHEGEGIAALLLLGLLAGDVYAVWVMVRYLTRKKDYGEE